MGGRELHGSTITLDHRDGSTGDLHQGGVVGCLGTTRMRRSKTLEGKPLWRLDRSELRPVDGPAGAVTQGIGDIEHRHGRIGTAADGSDDSFENRAGGEWASGVVDQHDVGIGWNDIEPVPNRRRAGRPSGDGDDGTTGGLGVPQVDIDRQDGDHPVAVFSSSRHRPVDHPMPAQRKELLGGTEPSAGTAGHHDGPHPALISMLLTHLTSVVRAHD